MGEVVARAFQIAASDPPGPVYLTLPREVLMTEVGDVRQPSPEQAPPARSGAGDPDVLRDVARRLVRSERPVVLTSTTGRTRQGFDGSRPARRTPGACPSSSGASARTSPTSHPLHQGFQPGPFVEAADLILVLDSDVPYIPTQVTPRPDATVVQIDLDPVKERIPLWSFPLTLAVRADTARALDLVADLRDGAPDRRTQATHRAAAGGLDRPSQRAPRGARSTGALGCAARRGRSPRSGSATASASSSGTRRIASSWTNRSRVTPPSGTISTPTSRKRCSEAADRRSAGDWAPHSASSWRGRIDRSCWWSATDRSSLASRWPRSGPAR